MRRVGSKRTTAPVSSHLMRTRSRVWVGVMAWLCCAITGAPIAQAQGDAAAERSSASAQTVRASVAPPVLPGHAWFLLRDQPQRRVGDEIIKGPISTLVFHLPPRGAAGGAGAGIGGLGRLGGAGGEGVIRGAPGFDGPVEAAAWAVNQAYFLQKEAVRPDGQRQRRVATFSVLRNALGGFDHLPGRPEALAPLIGDCDVLGWCATVEGPAVLVRDRFRADGERRSFGPIQLRVLFESAWRTIALDQACVDALADLHGPARRSAILMGSRVGLAIWVRSPDAMSATVWTGKVGAARDQSFGPPPLVQWASAVYPLTGENWPMRQGEADAARPDRVIFVPGSRAGDDAIIGAQRDGSDLRLMLLRPSGPIPMARLKNVPDDATLLPMAAIGSAGSGGLAFGAGGGRVALAWAERAPDAPADALNPRRVVQVREVSAGTGRLLFDGPARDAVLISSQDFKLLAIMLVMVMVAVILFVLRAEPGVSPELPAGWELADPIRRIAAALMDYTPGAVCAALVMGLPALSLLQPMGLIASGLNLVPIGLALLFAAVHCTIGEWLMGASLGKRLLGLRVISLRSESDFDRVLGTTVPPQRPALWQVAVRNLTRWLIPLLAIVALFDAGRRHPGDMLGRTIVVMESEPEADPS